VIVMKLEGVSGVLAVFNHLRSPAERKRLMGSLAKTVVTNSKRRVSAQTDLDSSPWAPRKDRSNRRKMLRKIGRLITVIRATENDALIGFDSARTARIAAAHQYGDSATVKADELNRRPGQQPGSTPATRQQAKALLEAGFKYRRRPGGYKTPSLKWITQNMSMAQASLVLRELRGARQQWTVTLPARSFLGVSEADKTELTNLAVSFLQQNIRRASP
jgi:phage virion morphogenesis protein